MQSRQDAMRELNELIESDPSLPVVESVWEVKRNADISGTVMSLLASANESAPLERKLMKAVVLEVTDRALVKTISLFANAELREFKVIREVSDFISAAVKGTQPKITQDNNDLLPMGHPFSLMTYESSQFITQADVNEYKALYASADPRISEEAKPLVASAMRARPNSVERKYLTAKLDSMGTSAVPRDIILSLLEQ